MADADVFGAMTADAVLPLAAIRRKFFTCSSVRRGSRRYGLAPKSLAISGVTVRSGWLPTRHISTTRTWSLSDPVAV